MKPMRTAQYGKARHQQLMQAEMAARSVFAGQFDRVEPDAPDAPRTMFGELTAQFMQSKFVRRALGAVGFAS